MSAEPLLVSVHLVVSEYYRVRSHSNALRIAFLRLYSLFFHHGWSGVFFCCYRLPFLCHRSMCSQSQTHRFRWGIGHPNAWLIVGKEWCVFYLFKPFLLQEKGKTGDPFSLIQFIVSRMMSGQQSPSVIFYGGYGWVQTMLAFLGVLRAISLSSLLWCYRYRLIRLYLENSL